MKSLVIIIAVLLFSVTGYSQSKMTKRDSTVAAFKYYVTRYTRYPAVARENDVEGNLVIEFKVEDDKISEVKIVKGLSPECDSGTLRLIRKYTGILQLRSKIYTIGLHYRMHKDDGKPDALIEPFNQKLYKRFLFETNIIGYSSIGKKSIVI